MPFLSYGTVVGGTALIELGMALEATGQPDKALSIYKKLVKQSGDEGIKKQAKQLEFGFEAMEFFGMASDGATEAAKLSQRSMGGPKLSNVSGFTARCPLLPSERVLVLCLTSELSRGN